VVVDVVHRAPVIFIQEVEAVARPFKGMVKILLLLEVVVEHMEEMEELLLLTVMGKFKHKLFLLLGGYQLMFQIVVMETEVVHL
jgi:hypothetical protein